MGRRTMPRTSSRPSWVAGMLLVVAIVVCSSGEQAEGQIESGGQNAQHPAMRATSEGALTASGSSFLSTDREATSSPLIGSALVKTVDGKDNKTDDKEDDDDEDDDDKDDDDKGKKGKGKKGK